jgi:pimeloyl-ACP methyl ester carboxylesterase
VGHDWGAAHAWNAAMMRPDRFKAVFCLSVPYVPRGDVSVFERMRKSGHQNDFYMFEQIRPDADQIWANAAVTIPGDSVLGIRFCSSRQTVESYGSRT